MIRSTNGFIGPISSALLSGVLVSADIEIASANLIQNGSFEDIGASKAYSYGSSRTWQVYSALPGWSATNNIEVWVNNFIVSSRDGKRVIELNGHPAVSSKKFSIFQSFATEPGKNYVLKFSAVKRSSNGEKFLVSVGDLNESIDSHAVKNWKDFKYEFTASSESSTLSFTSLNSWNRTVGNVIDDICIHPADIDDPNVCDPSFEYPSCALSPADYGNPDLETYAMIMANKEDAEADDDRYVGLSYTKPVISINPHTPLYNSQDIFYSLFTPEDTPYWPGNIKRFKISPVDGAIVDKENNIAVDPKTGLIKEGAKSFWSKKADGNDPTEGGVADQLKNWNQRDIYLYMESGLTAGQLTQFHYKNPDLISELTKILGLDGNDAKELIKWARSPEGQHKQQYSLSDSTHSQPVVIYYGGTEAKPDRTLYFTTNSGFLHAVDAESGEETFSIFIGKFLSHLQKLRDNQKGNEHPVALDGPISYWVKQTDDDPAIDASKNEHAYLYLTTRRGGDNIYAFDVTKRDKPKFLWSKDSSSTGMDKLGQTWSRLNKTKVRIGSTEKEVLLFGAGYDTNQDATKPANADTKGNGIYMLDAETGELLWSASEKDHDLNLSSMTCSIPSDLKVIDVDRDGFADKFFVGDMCGQLWGFDLNHGAKQSALVTGRVIAELGGSDVKDRRRFYHAPDISVFNRKGKRKLAVAIGSGYQANPLSQEIEDRFYMIFLDDVTTKTDLGSHVTLKETDLYDATANDIAKLTGEKREKAQEALEAKTGWFFKLGAGEKVLSSSYTADGGLYFTTFTPGDFDKSACGYGASNGRLYGVSVRDATGVQYSSKLTQDGVVSGLTERSFSLESPFVPTSPVPIKLQSSSGSKNMVCVGTECSALPGKDFNLNYWVVD